MPYFDIERAEGDDEWQKIGEKNKHPYAIALKKDEMFAFAGLWDHGKIRR